MLTPTPIRYIEHDNVEDALASTVRAEQLTGDNKYLCAVCATKQDADRQLELCDLPPGVCPVPPLPPFSRVPLWFTCGLGLRWEHTLHDHKPNVA